MRRSEEKDGCQAPLEGGPDSRFQGNGATGLYHAGVGVSDGRWRGVDVTRVGSIVMILGGFAVICECGSGPSWLCNKTGRKSRCGSTTFAVGSGSCVAVDVGSGSGVGDSGAGVELGVT